MADSPIRTEIRLPDGHPALFDKGGMRRHARLVDLIEKGLLYEDLEAKRNMFDDCLTQLQSLLQGNYSPVVREPVEVKKPEPTSDCGISPEKQRQALALMESFGIDLLS